jgi:hypothetical protein
LIVRRSSFHLPRTRLDLHTAVRKTLGFTIIRPTSFVWKVDIFGSASALRD